MGRAHEGPPSAPCGRLARRGYIHAATGHRGVPTALEEQTRGHHAAGRLSRFHSRRTRGSARRLPAVPLSDQLRIVSYEFVAIGHNRAGGTAAAATAAAAACRSSAPFRQRQPSISRPSSTSACRMDIMANVLLAAGASPAMVRRPFAARQRVPPCRCRWRFGALVPTLRRRLLQLPGPVVCRRQLHISIRGARRCLFVFVFREPPDLPSRGFAYCGFAPVSTTSVAMLLVCHAGALHRRGGGLCGHRLPPSVASLAGLE